MIVVLCRGGLGNQLFQYACGRSLARRAGGRLLLDLSHYERADEPRRFELDRFAVRYRRATLRDRARFMPLGRRAALLSAPWRLLDRGRCAVLRERHFHFDPEVLAARGHLYLEGFWQSPRYFEGLEVELRRELAPRAALAGPEAELAARIADVEAVAIHVRGGDYRDGAGSGGALGALVPEYYRGALAHLRESLRKPRFFVFSDDPAWARTVLPPGEGIEHASPRREGRGWADLWLMSRCRHQVIANSTFSWWAAWLNPFPGRVVVAPRRWFREGGHDTRDLYPAEWRLL